MKTVTTVYITIPFPYGCHVLEVLHIAFSRSQKKYFSTERSFLRLPKGYCVLGISRSCV